MSIASARWKSPSNIAIVKYWGKYPGQIPANASLSLTLNNCFTDTQVSLMEKTNAEKFSFRILLDGKEEAGFRTKISSFFEKIAGSFPWLEQYHLEINSHNSFPHSSGIASSASGMSALALCLCSLHEQLGNERFADFLRSASYFSRLGSGSACRSVYGTAAAWGKHPHIEGSSDEFAVPFSQEVHPLFSTMQDTILLVHKGSKSVSSTEGHELMHGHLFAKSRFESANNTLSGLLRVMKSGDLDAFIRIAESEALTLHAMMMSSNPYFILMKPQTLSIIEKVWQHRKESGVPVFFTLDAGANVHLLYPEDHKAAVHSFIDAELTQFCEKSEFIKDSTGKGPEML